VKAFIFYRLSKIMNAFTGGQPTAREQRMYGGIPEKCSVYKYYEMLFEEDDRKLKDRYLKCKNGEILCGECKRELAERVSKFLIKHQEAKERARDIIDSFLLRNKF